MRTEYDSTPITISSIFTTRENIFVETKIWRSDRLYAEGKQQLAAYLAAEGTTEGYYVVFDHREVPEPLTETGTVNGMTIRNYVIPVAQERLSREN